MGAQGEEQPQDVGRKRHYTDPMGSRAPELERCLIRHRALQMMLILYYAEELKRDVINGVAAQMHWRGHSATQPIGGEGPSQEGKKQRRAFDRLVQDGVLTDDERKHMVGLIGRRNSIAHHLDHVTADLTTDRTVREWLDYYPDRQTHDYEAFDQLRAARTLLSERMTAHHYVLEIDMRGMFFESTERVLSADLKTLERRIRSLMRQRRRDIAQLNAELSLEGSNLTGLFDPRWPENRYGNKQRLTPRGVETCYVLYDMGKSPLAVAHLHGPLADRGASPRATLETRRWPKSGAPTARRHSQSAHSRSSGRLTSRLASDTDDDGTARLSGAADIFERFVHPPQHGDERRFYGIRA